MSALSPRIDELPAGLDRWLLRTLDHQWGAANAIGRFALLESLRRYHGINVNERALRQRIAELREHGWPICSKGGIDGGYYMGDEDDVKDHARREDFRAKKILKRDSAMKRGAELSPDKQTGLF